MLCTEGRVGVRQLVVNSLLTYWRSLLVALQGAAKVGDSFTFFFAAGSALFFLGRYLGFGDLPGNSPHPLGWWGWWDQSQYLKSAAALAALNFDPVHHWYPLGYPLLGSLLFPVAPNHAFFFVDLAAFTAFGVLLILLARRLGLPGATGAGAFLIGVVFPPSLSMQYVIPWTTTPIAPLYTGFFVVYVDILTEGLTPRRVGLIAMLTALIAFIRPVDILPLVPAWLHVGVILLRLSATGRPHFKLVCRSALYGLCTGGGFLGAYLALHVVIYGLQASEYMRHSSGIGFDLSIIPFRYFMIFVNPRDFFGTGLGILERYPLMNIGLLGLVYSTLFQHRFIGISLAVWFSFIVYLSYVDFLPSGLWNYNNIHYFKWTFPILFLLTFSAAFDVWRNRTICKLVLAGLLILPLIFLDLRAGQQTPLLVKSNDQGTLELDLEGHNPSTSVAAIRLSGLINNYHPVYFGAHTLEVAGTHLRHIQDFRLIPNEDLIYLVFNRPRVIHNLLRLNLVEGVVVRSQPTATAISAEWSLRNPWCSFIKEVFYKEK